MASGSPATGAPFFIVASARSGTTFLRLALNAHPQLAVPPESRFITELHTADEVDPAAFLDALEAHERFRLWELPIEEVRRRLDGTFSGPIPYRRAVTAPFEAYAAHHSASRWGDKTPRYVEHIDLLARLFPEARFVHVIRDGRNVALSYSHVNFGPRTVAGVAELWARRVRAGIARGRTLERGRYLEIRSEDLAEDPEGELHDICDFLDLDFDPVMLDKNAQSKGVVAKPTHNYSPEAAGRKGMSSWQEDMKPGHVEMFEAVAGDLLSELGYERRYPSPGKTAKLTAALARRGIPVGRIR
ncbi:MAG: sulfotransferase family protein [Actinomycetota bacterium]